MMNKKPILFVFLSLLFFLSCSKKNDNLVRHSSGKINSISVVIDDNLWYGVIGDSIRNKFARPVEGLPKEEPLFDINQYPTHLMEGFMTKSRTIIVIKKTDQNVFEIKKDQYATPQNVFHISGKSVSAILEILETHAPQIIQIIEKGEIIEHQRLLSDSILNPKVIQKQFQVVLKVPNSYSYTIKKTDFVWLKKECISGSNSLLISKLPLSSIKSNLNVFSRILKLQDSIGGLYVKGTEPESTMYIDQSYPIYFFKTKVGGKVAYVTKGTWRLKDSFMFGPFVNYMILDADKNRILFLEGFSYSPSRDKRDFMHELESVIQGAKM
ncbi:DUF4837 family protein [Flavobacterium aestivum]|uniref:DUF4837 family protein n=1 Tax=Flavobacterium aestivum TaxID=3003257 RepID=UPI00248326D7|nr:DUF4837 family protein [Flavobacterium aestivum]